MRNKEKEILTALVVEESKEIETPKIETPRRRRRSRGIFRIGQYPEYDGLRLPFSIRFPS